MDTLEWAAEMDETSTCVGDDHKRRILDEHGNPPDAHETDGMGYVELFQWLGY